MAAVRIRRRLNAPKMLGATLIATLAVGPSSASAKSSALGSSCANPETLSLTAAPGGVTGNPLKNRIMAVGGPADAKPGSFLWYAPPGEMVCSVRLQLANGSLAQPSETFPYTTPYPTGGQYLEITDPATRLTAVTITAAKPPVPIGESCAFPLQGSARETPGPNADPRVGGPRPPVYVKLVGLSPSQLRLKVTPHRPGLVLCPKASFRVRETNPAGEFTGFLNFVVPVNPHTGLTSVINLPPSATYGPGEGVGLMEAWGYARIAKSL